jgi:hypothetical protein
MRFISRLFVISLSTLTFVRGAVDEPCVGVDDRAGKYAALNQQKHQTARYSAKL